MYINQKSGVTFIEVVIVITIILIVSSIVVMGLSKFRNEQALKNTTVDIVSILNKARQNTLSSINSTNYGVHFDTDKMVLFTGPAYFIGVATNEPSVFSTAVSIPTVGGLNIGGGSDVVFERLTGETVGGTIHIELISDPTKQKTITIDKTGLISSN